MATRQQVLSLFGATPQQIMEQERLRQAEFLQSQRDPFQSAGAAIGVGLGRLFGGESAEVQAARQMQEAVSGVDTSDPQALRQLAQTVSQFAPERALQISAYATELEKSQRPDVDYREVIIGYTQEPIVDGFGQPTGKFQEVPIKDTAIIQNGQITGYTSGRPLGSEQAPVGIADTPEAQASRAAQQTDTTSRMIWDAEQGRTVPNPNYQQPEQEVTTNVGPEAQERIMQQSGASRTARTGETGVGIAPPPKIEATPVFTPEALQAEIEGLQEQMEGLPANAPRRKNLQREINKLRAKIRQSKPKGTTRNRRGR